MPKIVASRKGDYFGYPSSSGIRGILSLDGFMFLSSLNRTVVSPISNKSVVYSNRIRIL